MPQPTTAKNIQDAKAAFDGAMAALRRKQLAWMAQVVSRMEKEKVAALRASLTK